MSRTRTSLAALVLAVAGAIGTAAPALAADCPEHGTVIMSNETFDRYVAASPDEQRLIMEDPAYFEVWQNCLPPSHVERNAWGPGYVCLPEGAVQ
ncbi:hypothetical protein GCM10010329_46390 [Streptomyces spiroverticillatus]|uniref:Secreted protein n=1 Tax=Streptomyces finlayi TaxID=67296 RepID=A0A919CBA2_9ACTN|nr:hypothetical protein [Streptomyces finlayi]GHA18006.1 hypothetical protein GCM10010329_46390 [Streptomyces spiroverticillatus]GHC99718.1 hypothetical protein GCM10010334_43560 [Streptomyces finlayi]